MSGKIPLLLLVSSINIDILSIEFNFIKTFVQVLLLQHIAEGFRADFGVQAAEGRMKEYNINKRKPDPSSAVNHFLLEIPLLLA
jgi:hypothetical protein